MKILMPTYGGGHVAMVIPLARELLRRGHEVLILPLSVAQLALEKTELPYITLPEALERAYPEPERQASTVPPDPASAPVSH